VALGSSLGATLRLLVSGAMGGLSVGPVPWAIFAVNLTGSFLVGAVFGWFGPAGTALHAQRGRLFLVAGVLGGFTTFSVFSLETVELLVGGRPGIAALHLTAALLLWVPAAGAGYTLVSNSIALRGDRS
jgi:fluoride exporter